MPYFGIGQGIGGPPSILRGSHIANEPEEKEEEEEQDTTEDTNTEE